MELSITPGGRLCGEIHVAADKSISHRAIIFSAIANGVSRVRNLLQGEDVFATMSAFRQMGVSIEHLDAGQVEITGVGLHGLNQPAKTLDLGNSGTALRLIAGLMCAQRWSSTLSGDASLRARPMERIIEPLTRMGARIDAVNDRPPLKISCAPKLQGIDYRMPIASAQVKSSLLLAGLYADGDTTLVEPAPTRDHTERMLERFGCSIIYNDNAGEKEIRLHPPHELHACEIDVPADLSSAAFFLVGASIMHGSDALLCNVGINPSRSGVLSILERMGANIELLNHNVIGGEPCADIRVRAATLQGCRIAGDDIALAIDEIPAIAVAAACAHGVTEIHDAAELRVKESDRLSSVATGLAALGVEVEERADGLRIVGGGLNGGRVDSYGDHRIAMAFAIAGGAARGTVEIANCDNIATSFPGFSQIAHQAGLDIDVG